MSPSEGARAADPGACGQRLDEAIGWCADRRGRDEHDARWSEGRKGRRPLTFHEVSHRCGGRMSRRCMRAPQRTASRELRLDNVSLGFRRRAFWKRLPWWKGDLGRGGRRMRESDLDEYIRARGGRVHYGLRLQGEGREAVRVRLLREGDPLQRRSAAGVTRSRSGSRLKRETLGSPTRRGWSPCCLHSTRLR